MPDNTLATGNRLEEYRIESVLGMGGFGITYKARDLHLDARVAIKEYFPTDWSYRERDGLTVEPNAYGRKPGQDTESSYYQWGLDRFLDEARVLARIKHPHIVRVNRYFLANGTAYIVMEYEAGETLDKILARRGTLSENDLYGLLEEVLPALQTVHKHGYLHRDLKPSNLYVRSRDGCVMLIDFGAARQTVGRQSKSITGLMSPGYSPPEQYALRSHHYGNWTDIYALGAVLYRCITGAPPVEATERLIEDHLVPATEAVAGIYNPKLLAIIDHCLTVRPGERYKSIAEIQADLAQAKLVGVKATMELAPQATPERKKPRATQETTKIETPSRQPTPPPDIQEQAPVKSAPAKKNQSTGLLAAAVMATVVLVGWWGVSHWLPGSKETVPLAIPPQQTQISEASEQELPDAPAEQAAAAPFQTGADDADSSSDQTTQSTTTTASINPLLQLANESLADYRLTKPANNNALFYFDRILELDPDNEAAIRGKQKIARRYHALAQRAVDKSEHDKARLLIAVGLAIDAKDRQLLALQKRIGE